MKKVVKIILPIALITIILIGFFCLNKGNNKGNKNHSQNGEFCTQKNKDC